jgi:hypothetical protein
VQFASFDGDGVLGRSSKQAHQSPTCGPVVASAMLNQRWGLAVYNPLMSSTETTAEALTGSIERVTFHNPDNGFAVLRLKVKGRTELVSVVGYLVSTAEGENVEAGGRPEEALRFEGAASEAR